MIQKPQIIYFIHENFLGTLICRSRNTYQSNQFSIQILLLLIFTKNNLNNQLNKQRLRIKKTHLSKFPCKLLLFSFIIIFHCSNIINRIISSMFASALLKSKSMVHHKVPASANESVDFGISETSAYLKKEIGEIIKTEIKAYHLRNKMQEDLQQYKKQQENKKLARTLMEDRMHDFREKQRNFGRKKYELFQKRQRQREQKLKSFLANKKGAHEIKCIKFNRSIGNVRERYFNISNEDANMRLSKIVPNTAQGKRIYSSSRSLCRVASISQSSSRVNVIKDVQMQEEKHKITNYLNKLEKSQSRIILKQLENEKRRETSMRKKVKCLIGQRKKLEEARMEKAQKQYHEKMQNFEENYSKIAENKEISLMSRTMVNTKLREKIVQKRQQLHKQEIDKILNNFSKAGKENLMEQYRSALDLAYTLKNKSINMTKMKMEESQADLEHKMRSLVQKIQKIKDIQYGQKLDDYSIKTILSMMDKSDPEYAQIAEFLKTERRTFIEGIVKKQEEKNKLKKMNKTLNKTSIS